MADNRLAVRSKSRHYTKGRLIRLDAELWAYLDRVKRSTGRPVTEQIRELIRRESSRAGPGHPLS